MSGTTSPGTQPFELRNRRASGDTTTDDPVLDEITEASDLAEDYEPETPEATGVPDQVPEDPRDRPVVEKASPARSSIEPWTWGVVGVAVIALALAWWFWNSQGPSEEAQRATLRDQVVVQGTRAVETLQTMDHRDIEGGLTRWEEVTTGVLHDQFGAMTDAEREAIADAGKVTTARVVSAGLTELNPTSATMIASTEVSVSSDDSQTPTVKRNRWAAELTLVDGVWKIENMQQVQVNIS